MQPRAAQVEAAPADLGQRAVELDRIDPRVRIEAALGTGDRAGRVAEDRDRHDPQPPQPKPATARTANDNAKPKNVRWVPTVGISSSAAKKVPTSDPIVEIAYRLPIVVAVSLIRGTLRRLA
jgi:hypothetical protein